MTAVLGAHDAKIAELLLLGNSVDVLAEQGLKRGWTRNDVLRVASGNGWELDPSGRIPRALRSHPVPAAPAAAAAAPAAASPAAVSVPPLWAALTAARTHRVPKIHNRANKLHEQLQQLAKDVEAAKDEQKVLDRLAVLEAERQQLRAQLAVTAGRKPKPIDHGTLGGYRAHRRRDEPACDSCQAASDTHMANMRARSSRGGKR